MNTTEPHIIIDEERNIYVPDELQRIAVQYDHNIETVTFDCPRYWDGHDLSAMAIYISYMRPDNELGTYIAEKVRIDSEDDSIFHFDWTITNFLTAIDGKIRFIVCVKKVDAEGNETQHWNSELNTEMYVSQGLDCSSELSDVADTYPDIITQLINNTCSKYEIETMLATKADADKVYTKAEVDELTKVDDQLSTLSSSTRPVQNTVVSKAISDDRVRIKSCEDSIDEIKSSKGYVPIRYVEGTKDFNTDFMLSSTDPDKVVFSNSDKTVQINSPFTSDLFPYLLVVERVKFGVTETAYDLRQTCITVKNAGSESVEFVEHQRIYMGGPNPIWTAWKQCENSITDNVYTKAEVDELIPEIDDELNAASTNPVQNQAITTTLYGVSSQATQLQSKVANMYTKAEVDELTKVDDQLSTLSSSTRPVQNTVVSKAISDDRVRIKSCEDSIDDLEETVASQGNTITWLNNNKANSSTVNALQTSVTNIGNTVTNHNIRITKVEQSTADMYTKSEVDTKLSTLQTKTDNMYTKAEVDELTKVDDQLSTLSSSTRPVQNTVVSKAISDDRVRIKSCEDSIANMYTKAEVDELIPEIDDELNAASTNPVQNQAITTTLYGVSSQATQLQSKVANMYTKAEVDELIPEIDDELNAASHNPVENQVIYNEISTLHREVSQNGDDIGIHDNEITVLNNQVTSLSNGLSATVTTANTAKTNSATALEGVALNKSTLGYQKKNLLNNFYTLGSAHSWGDISWSTNSDRSITVKGTASGSTDYPIGKAYLTEGKYIFTTSSPMKLHLYDGTNTSHIKGWVIDSSQTITITESNNYVLRIFMSNGDTHDTTFYFMLRNADVTDDTYEPYVDDVDTRITDNTNDIATNQATLGYQKTKNLLPYTSITVIDLTYTYDNNGYLTSTATNDNRSFISTHANRSVFLEAGTYIYSTYIKTVPTSSGHHFMKAVDENNNEIFATHLTTNNKVTFTLTESKTVYLIEKINDGSMAAMIRHADITDNTYEPYVESVDERLNALLARIEALENA